jgi:Leucine-rich repeat (LRR) protein
MNYRWLLSLSYLLCLIGWSPTVSAQTQSSSELSPAQIEEYQAQAGQLVSFLQYMMNVLGDKSATTQDKETIIRQSYLKAFRDAEVQIEDDLDENRNVVTNKNVQAYLKDIDFFFREAKFEFLVDDISYYVAEGGRVFFRVTANRNLQGVTITGDTVNTSQVRYIEVNLDPSAKGLKIASIYTTKLSEREELASWWSGVPDAWRDYFKERLGASAYDSADYRMLREIVRFTEVDVAGRSSIWDLSPLSKLADLKYIDVSGTRVTDLVPLRNLTKLEVLNCSQTNVVDLTPLRYATSLRELVCEETKVTDLRLLASFPKLEKLYCSGSPVRTLVTIPGLKDLRCASTPIANLSPLAGMVALVSLDCSQTSVSDLQPLASATQLRVLNIEGTAVRDLASLQQLANLHVLLCNNTPIENLSPLNGLPALEKVYCDNTAITPAEASRFMAVNPKTLVIFESGQLQTWWNALAPEWKRIFAGYIQVEGEVTKEKLAQVANLTEIDITGNQSITTLEPLTKITALQTLKAAQTSIRSLDPLRELLGLEHLDCSNTAIDSLGALSNARNLRILNVDHTQVKSLSALGELSGIQRLSCEQTPLPDIAIRRFIEEHPETVVIYKSSKLSLWWNALPPAWKSLLKEQVTMDDIPNREQLHEIAFIKSLTIPENSSINSLEPLSEFVRLTELAFSNTSISSLEPLRPLTTLRALICSRSPIRNLDPLRNLLSLTYLDFQNTPVEEIDPLENSIELETIKCSGTQVDDLRPLSALINLKRLECFNTDVKKLKPLKGLYQLEELHCYNTRVSKRRVSKFRSWHPDCKVVYY